MKTDLYMEKLVAFHDQFGHTSNGSPTIISNPDKELRIRLMREELKELIDAMMEGNLIKIAKELADLLYVVFGTALAYGLPMQLIFGAVHVSNMTKSEIKDGGGKTIKGITYQEPDIRSILERETPVVR